MLFTCCTRFAAPTSLTAGRGWAFLGRGKIFPFFSLQYRFSVVIYESEEENDPTEEELL